MKTHTIGCSQTIGYCRVSSSTQSSNTSLPHQQLKIQEYCKLHDLQLDECYSECDSGGNDDRVVLGTIKDLIQSNQVSTLICFKVDRLGRSMLGSLQFIELCKQHTVRVICISESLDTNNESSSLLFNLLMSIATEERRIIKKRCDDGRRYKWLNNQIPFSSIPFGYSRTKKGEVEPNENKHIVRYIFKKFNLLCKMKHLSKTKRMQRMLKLLNMRGYTFNGNKFKNHNIRIIIRNSFYCGLVRWRGSESVSTVEPIVSKRLFNSLQGVI